MKNAVHLGKKLIAAIFGVIIYCLSGIKVSFIMQVLYSPRRCPGLGLTDGEGIERLWSYLRKFSYMTKETKPNRRTDILSEALLHYARRMLSNQGESIDSSSCGHEYG